MLSILAQFIVTSNPEAAKQVLEAAKAASMMLPLA